MRGFIPHLCCKSRMHRKQDKQLTGTGQVLFGPAEDAEGNKVLDTDGKEILYPEWGRTMVHRMIFL